VAATQAQLDAKKDTGITAVTGCAVYRIQYRTTRGDGSAAVSSARVYLPQVPVVPEPPVVVAAHGTEGLAASCATSMNATSMEDLALPWVALGYPVIAPDYAGLGTTGVQGYEDNRDTARSVVDAVAALRQFVDRPLGQQVVIDGHSQGGGAALATQSLAASMGLRGTLAAVIAFAPEYFSRMGSLGYVASLESAASTNPLTISTGVTKCTVATMMEYAYFANHVVGAAPTDGFPASDATKLGGAITSLCTVPLGGAVQLDAPHVADWTDGTFRGEFLACVNGVGDGGTACTGAGAAFFGFLSQNLLPPDPAGAPVLVVQGLADTVMPPAEEAACNVDALQAGGLTPTVCTDSAATHTDVVARNIAFGITWAQAIVAGTAAPACTASALPACSQP
jgi:pimeloyl-ACP methyl ester carboxylesterase